MSIVRVGLAETKNFSDGWDAIFKGKASKPAKAAASSGKKKKKGKGKKR